MKNNDKLYNSVLEISKAVSNGQFSDVALIKASKIYKFKIRFKENSTYKAIKSKTFNNYLKNIDNPQSLMKALVLGETKVKNGILYVVKQTPSGKLDWRRANKQKKKKQDNKINLEELFDTEDFPKKLSDVKIIKSLGGSTGAELVEDNIGNKYVLKKGNSNEHIKEEFLTNCIYKAMGVNVPTFKLYEENGKNFTLSNFIENTTPIMNVLDEQYIEDLSENYVLDCLLANWDIYKNDNILVDDDSGKIFRVDNGGGLRYSAQGRDKGDNFEDDVDEIETMLTNNPWLSVGITSESINDQINNIVKNKNKILSLIDDVELKKKMSMRIANLAMRVDNDNKDPYRELSEKDLKKAMKACGGNLFATNDVEGWIFLSKISKMRGFNGTPTVINKDQFEELLSDDSSIMINRGLTSYGQKSAKELMREFCNSEHCFYGQAGIYGAGIYGSVNNLKQNKGNDYELALAYAEGEKENVMDIILTPEMRIIDAKKLDEMMYEEFFGEEFKERQLEYSKEVENRNNLYKEQDDLKNEIELKTKKELGWDDKSYRSILFSRPDEVYADTKKYNFSKILNYFKPILRNINGEINKIDENNFKIVLNNGNSFILNKNVSEDSNALKQKNENTKPYNYQYRLLRKFILDEHFNKIKSQVNEKIKLSERIDERFKEIKIKIQNSDNKIKKLSDEVSKIKEEGKKDNLNEILSEIAKRPGGEYRGFYAAIKGYDGFIQQSASNGVDYCIVLNRSKLMVKEFE